MLEQSLWNGHSLTVVVEHSWSNSNSGTVVVNSDGGTVIVEQ